MESVIQTARPSVGPVKLFRKEIRPIKVLNLLYSDFHVCGGAGIAMHGLHIGLRENGVESKILCRIKTLDSPHITQMRIAPSVKRAEAAIGKFAQRLGFNDLHYFSSFGIKNTDEYREADILHIHGLHGGFFSPLALPGLTRGKPSIYTLHDIWAITGHCAASISCTKWKTGCGKCPHPEIHPAIRKDTTRMMWKIKNWAYRNSDFVVTTESRWLVGLLRESMLSGFETHYIPNSVDMDLYKPGDKEKARALLGIAPGRKAILFVSQKLNDYMKGTDLLVKALRALSPALRAGTVLMALGNSGEFLSSAVPMRVLDLGYAGGDHLKALCYSAADLVVFPTRADNAPMVIMESIACGTPVVSFSVGGVPESVRPGLTGLLCEPEDFTGMAKAIEEILEDDILRLRMRARCREIALREYSRAVQIERFYELYKKMLGR
jgi:glycosyltransferase involved in cell wall biosynthesis